MYKESELSGFGLSPELTRELFHNSELKTFPAGSVILSEHAPIRAIPLVVRGTLRVMRTDEEEDKEILLYYIRSGESCIMSFLGGLHHEPSKVRAIVEEDAEILFLPIEKVNILIKEQPQWVDYIFKLYHKRFEELLEMINAITFKKVDERLLDLLNKKSALTNSRTLEITHQQLANKLGTARVVVSRLLKQLEDEGKVKLGRNRIDLL